MGKTLAGSVTVWKCKDVIDVTTNGGNIDIPNCYGKITASTLAGSFILNNLSGLICAKTNGGLIKGNNIKGELIANNLGGSIEFDNLACSIDAITNGGRINIKVSNLSGNIILKNLAGDIDMQIPKNKKISLNISALTVSTEMLQNFSGKLSDKSIQGNINNGGISINAIAASGKINLQFN